MSIYDFVVKDNKGTDVPMSDYKGKTLIIVNTATGCGFTPQYIFVNKKLSHSANRKVVK